MAGAFSGNRSNRAPRSRQHHSREWPKPIQCASSRCRSGPSQACFRAGARRLHSAATSDLVRYSRESSFSRLGETPPYPASGQHLRQPVEEPDPKLDRRCFIVRDANGQALAYVYFEGEPGRRGGSPAHVRRCTVLAAMRRYEFCQVFCRGIRAKLRCSLIPFSRLGNIRLNSDSAEPPD